MRSAVSVLCISGAVGGDSNDAIHCRHVGLSSSRERRHPTSVVAGATLGRYDVEKSDLPSATTPEPGQRPLTTTRRCCCQSRVKLTLIIFIDLNTF